MTGFQACLEEEIARCGAQHAALKAEMREDEANFAQIRRNIFDVCLTVHRALERRLAGDALAHTYLDKLDGFAVSWGKALELAEEHGESDKAAVERVKLEALCEIRRRFAGGEG